MQNTRNSIGEDKQQGCPNLSSLPLSLFYWIFVNFLRRQMTRLAARAHCVRSIIEEHVMGGNSRQA